MMMFVYIYLVLLLFGSLQTSYGAPPRNPSSGQPPVLTGVSGCSYQSSIQTIDCPRPVILTLTGSGFVTSLENDFYPSIFLRVSLFAPGNTYAYPCTLLSTRPINDTMIVCDITNNGYGQYPTNVMMDIKLSNSKTGNVTWLRNAVSFPYEVAPRIDSISGCPVVSSDGRTVSHCDVEDNEITLHGIGFMSVDHSNAKFTFGSSSRVLYMYRDNTLIVRYTNDEIVLNFGLSSLFLPAIDIQGGKPVPLILADSVNNQIWSTHAVYVVFKPLKPPIIQSVIPVFDSLRGGCVVDNSTSTDRYMYRDCIAGRSQLTITGDHFFAGLTVYAGDQSCGIISTTNASIIVLMPVYTFTEGRFYDLIVTTVIGSATLSSVIEFDTNPIITSLIPCIDTANINDVGIYCRPNETLTIKVLNFKRSDLPRVWIRSLITTVVLQECSQVQILDRETVICMIPMYPSLSANTRVWIEWEDGNMTNDVSPSHLWDSVDAPRVTSLSGCYSDSNDPLHLNQCLGQADAAIILTIHGVRLNNSPRAPWDVFVNNSQYQRCDQPYIVDTNTMTCLLPMLDDVIDQRDLVYNVKYPVRLWGSSSTAITGSNAGYITFVQQENHSSGSSSSLSTSIIAIATVFSVIGAVLLGVLLLLACRNTSIKDSFLQSFARRHENDTNMDSEFSSSSRHVELTEVE